MLDEETRTPTNDRRGRNRNADRSGEQLRPNPGRFRRCAVYTRKSSDEGLEQSFNSLDAQREACEAYIASQKHEGWKLVTTAYDDRGLSGGTMNRPALQRLLCDITAGRVDVVVVYKVDRLTRSLADFAKLTDLLDSAGASFVSVTQAFNTSTSMGRLTLNVLLSFAQFEREVAGERIRDKIAASKKRGMWMGGMPPLGYDVCDKQLVVNESEAKSVQTIFESYVKLGTVAKLKAAMDAQGVVSKVRIIKGKTTGGVPISRNGYHTILKCPLYRGMIHHKGELYPGNHKSIISEELWDQVQARLDANGSRVTGANAASSSQGQPSKQGSAQAKLSHLLTGILFDGSGGRLSPSHSTKLVKGTRSRGGRTRRYDYYVSASLVRGRSAGGHGNSRQDTMRLSAPQLDSLVMDAVRNHLADDTWTTGLTLDSTSVKMVRQIVEAARRACTNLQPQNIRALLHRVIIQPDAIEVTLRPEGLAHLLGVEPDLLTREAITIRQPSSILRDGRSTKLIIGSVDIEEPKVDQQLIDQLKQAHRWWQMLVTGKASSITDLAWLERVDPSEVSRTITLAFLDPRITRMVLQGTQPPSLTLDALRRARPLPANWKEQRQVLLS